jgi:hypothetical protein
VTNTKEEPITTAKEQKSTQISGFKFNPIPNKEELY